MLGSRGTVACQSKPHQAKIRPLDPFKAQQSPPENQEKNMEKVLSAAKNPHLPKQGNVEAKALGQRILMTHSG